MQVSNQNTEACRHAQHIKPDGQQQQNTTPGAPPVSWDQETEVMIRTHGHQN